MKQMAAVWVRNVTEDRILYVADSAKNLRSTTNRIVLLPGDTVSLYTDRTFTRFSRRKPARRAL